MYFQVYGSTGVQMAAEHHQEDWGHTAAADADNAGDTAMMTMRGDETIKTSEAVLINAHKRLEYVDAVTDVDVLQVIGNYVKAGGQPKDALQMLAKNYRGYGPMASLVCSWIHSWTQMGVKENKEHQSVKRQEQEDIQADDETHNRSDDIEWEFLSEILTETFDTSMADRLFDEGKGAPEWLQVSFHIKALTWMHT